MRYLHIPKTLAILPFISILGINTSVAVEETEAPADVVADFDISPKDEDYFGWLPGETYNTRTGDLGYYVTDMRIEGNGSLDIVINRKFSKVADQPLAGDALYPHLFGSMSLDLPRIEFTTQEVVRSAKDVELWNAAQASNPPEERITYTVDPFAATPRCSGLDLYVHVSGAVDGPSGTVVNPTGLVSGITFHINNKTINFYPKDLSTNNGRFPAAAEYVSPDNWYVDCVGTTWKVYRPNGLVYTLDEYEYRNTGYLRHNILDNANKKTVYVKSIQDPRGNTLTYDYETVTRKMPVWKQINNSVNERHTHNYAEQKILKTITANDGRVVTVTRRSQPDIDCPILIDRIDYNFNDTKEIRYQYNAQGSSCWLDLNRVYRNDNSNFVYEYYNPLNNTNNPLNGSEEWPEPEPTSVDGTPVSQSHSLFRLKNIHYPEGAKVNYTYGKSSNCFFNQKIFVAGSETCQDKSVLRTRTITGDHLPAGMTWNFGFSKFDSNGEVLGSPTNPQYTKSIVDGPATNGKRNRQEFDYAIFEANTDPGNASAINGQLIRKAVVETDIQTDAKTLIKETRYTYGLGASVVDFANFGWSQYTVKPWQTLHYTRDRKVHERTITQGGHEFRTVYGSYDSFGHPTRIAQYHNDSSAAEVGRTQDISYYYNSSPWIVGKIQTKTVDHEDATIVDRTFTAYGEVEEETIYGIKSTYFYHANGELHHIKNGNGTNTRIYKNYKLGIPQTIEKPGATKTRVVNSKGQMISETDWLGNSTLFEYNDALGRQSKVNPPVQIHTSTQWPVWHDNAHARYRKKITTHGSHYQEVTEYDALGRPIREYTKDNSSNKHVIVYYKYAANGELAFQSLPTDEVLDLAGVINGSVATPLGIEYQYDALGRVTQEKNTADNSVTTRCYGTAGCGSQIPQSLVRHGVGTIDPEGHYHVVNYRAYGNPDDAKITEIIQQRIKTNPNARVKTVIVRDRLGFIKNVSQGGKQRIYSYQSGKRLLASVNHPETGITTFDDYDNAGNLKKKTNAVGEITTYTYDANELLTDEVYPTGTSAIVYEYDANGSTTRMTTAGTVLDYRYRDDGLLEKETLSIDAESMELHYDYNSLGHLKKLIYPSGQVVHYASNVFGQTTSITNYVDQLSYFPNGQLHSAQYANGQVFTGTQTERQFPKKWTSVSGYNTAIDQTYEYDLRGNVKKLTDHITPTYSLSNMLYDGLNRLTRAHGQWGVGTFTYNYNGDITSMRLGSETLSYDYNHTYTSPNRTGLLYKVTSTSGLKNYEFDYDTNGNVIDNSRFGFVYDAASRMIHADVNGRIYDFIYDGNGRRVRAIRQDTNQNNTPIPGTKVTEYFFYNQAGNLVFEKNKDTNQHKDHIYVNGKHLAYRSYHNDSTDSDGDGLPDYYEDLYGLATDHADATQDADADGLSNLQEFLIGANPNSTDTDNDGINDHLENLFALNVVIDDGEQDLDGDDLTNKEEIDAGTSPNDALTQSRMLNALPAIQMLMAP